MTDWAQVRETAISAAKQRLGNAWDRVSGVAVAQISGLVAVAQYIESQKDALSVENYQHLMKLQQTALEGALAGIEIISITSAQNTANDVMKIIIKSLPGLKL